MNEESTAVLNYAEINARAVDLLLAVGKHVSSIDGSLRSLVELRVSQINGCSYCIDLHANEAREAGEAQQRLDCLTVWRECSLFTDREMAALEWAESVTAIAGSSDMDGKLSDLLERFDAREAVDLTLIVALMNCMNRLGISFGDKPSVRRT